MRSPFGIFSIMQQHSPTERFVRDMTRYQTSLFGFILSLVPQPDAARDILQNTNVVLWQKSSRYEECTDFLAWAREVARREVLAYRRDHARDRLVFDDAILHRLADIGQALDQEPDDKARAFEDCLAGLPKRQRELISARYSPGGSVKEMAEARGQSAAALSVTLSRIRKSLALCVQRKLQKASST